MPDPVDDPATRLEPMKILNFKEAGAKVVEWARNPASRPRDIEEFRAQLDQLVDVPARFKEIQIVQGYDHVFFLRLPPKNQVTQSQEDIESGDIGLSDYGLPDFYVDAFKNPDAFDQRSFFFSRIADYTIRGCR